MNKENISALSFPVLAVGVSIAAYRHPTVFADMRDFIVPGLVLIMFSMGATLKPTDFKRILKRPSPIFWTVGLQFTIMPLSAFIISKAMGLPRELLVGMVLVGGVSGGTASNVVCYLGKADVPLSIAMTTVSTILAVAMTPILSWLYLSQSTPVEPNGT